ncbi:hypothetical protein Droror1_Dr00024439 [Drosera rotundifolia]
MVAGSNTMQLVMPAESMDLHAQPLVFSNMDVQPAYHQGQAPPECPVAIFWDMENCPVPNDVRPEDVAVSIRMALKFHPLIKGSITTFSAYGDFNNFPRRLREGCQRTGVKLVDVPNGRKDAADKAILIDMFLFALDHCPPSSIMLISGDVDFSPALHVLGQRGYTVILVIPSQGYVSSALSNAGRVPYYRGGGDCLRWYLAKGFLLNESSWATCIFILVSFSLGKISLSLFEKIYRQRYKRPLNYQRFGATGWRSCLTK